VRKQSVEARRTEILETTCQVVIERGFAGTRMSDVAKRLDVSTSLIHYHFDSKEQLLAEAFAHFARQDLAALEAQIRAAPTAADQLDCFLQDSVPEGSDDMEWMLWIDAWGEALRNPAMRQISQELDRQSLKVLEGIIRHGVELHEFRCESPSDAAERIASLIDGLAVQFAAHDGVIGREDLLRHLRTAAAAETGAMLGPATASGSAGMPVADDAALTRLVHRAADATSRRDGATWSELWAADGRWIRSDGMAVEGRDAIAAAFDRDLAAIEFVVQTAPTMVFEAGPSATAASGRVTVHERLRRRGDPHTEVWGIYHDRYVRTSAGWQFAERRFELISAD
jgi:AcrR family transcriptional regulator